METNERRKKRSKWLKECYKQREMEYMKMTMDVLRHK